MEREYTSEELSAEVIKKLKSLILNEEVKSIVVTVPAKFTINQKDATRRAIEQAGFQQSELLQEPIAASMAYGLDSKINQGYWLVFDFGGGTFDAALLKVEDGIMKVIDTEGDNYLGGKNLDYAIVDEIIIPYLAKEYKIESILKDDLKKDVLREAMKFYAEDTKIQMSFKDTHDILSDLGDIPGEDDDGNEFSLDLTVTQEQIEKIFHPIFEKTVDICRDLLIRNDVRGDQLETTILVGGPTYSPILRKLLNEKITTKIDTSVDPMTVVARGAALYASTIDISEKVLEETRDISKIQLSLKYEPTTVEMNELVTVKVLRDNSVGVIPEKIYCEITRSDKAWSSGKTEIGEPGDLIEVKLDSNKSNLFGVILYDEQGNKLPSEPDELTIIQGSKVGSALLPYSIGIEANIIKKGKAGFTPVIGLEKNQSMPAKGILNGLKTQNQIRPGMKEDFIKIPIYQGDYYAEGSRAIYNELVYDGIISGEDLPSLLPADSEVDLTFNIDKSEEMTLQAYFPYLDFSCEISVPKGNVQKEIDAEWLDTEIQKTKHSSNIMIQEDSTSGNQDIRKINEEINELEKLQQQGKSDYDRKKQVLNNLRSVSRKLDKIQEEREWPKTEEELKEIFYELEKVDSELGNEKTNQLVKQFKDQIPQVLKEKNVTVAKEIIEQLRALHFVIVDEGLGPKFEIMLLQQFNENFNTHDWSDPGKARLLINQGLQIATDNPTKNQLRPVVMEIYKLLPIVEQEKLFPDDKSLLIK